MNDNDKKPNKTEKSSEEKYEEALKKYLPESEAEDPKQYKHQVLYEENDKIFN